MPPPPNHSVGPADIEKLLELLNASEGREEAVDQAENAPVAQEGVSTPVPPPLEPDPVDHAADSLEATENEAIENRFAAHIVQGMSKLKRG